MRVTAILAVRNERAYLGNCLGHLIENGLDYIVVDNGSTDGTTELLKQPRFARHLLDVRSHPYNGAFDWTGLMQARETAARDCGADWVLFVSADEVMHSYVAGETLAEGIVRLDAAGAEVIDFNEFVFLPVDQDYASDTPGPQPMRHYYFFEPTRPRLMRARRRALDVSHVAHGGHVLDGARFRLAEESFALRHYLFRDQAHARAKYAARVFRQDELERGWHHNRAGVEANRFDFPSAETLCRLNSISPPNGPCSMSIYSVWDALWSLTLAAWTRLFSPGRRTRRWAATCSPS